MAISFFNSYISFLYKIKLSTLDLSLDKIYVHEFSYYIETKKVHKVF